MIVVRLRCWCMLGNRNQCDSPGGVWLSPRRPPAAQRTGRRSPWCGRLWSSSAPAMGDRTEVIQGSDWTPARPWESYLIQLLWRSEGRQPVQSDVELPLYNVFQRKPLKRNYITTTDAWMRHQQQITWIRSPLGSLVTSSTFCCFSISARSIVRLRDKHTTFMPTDSSEVCVCSFKGLVPAQEVVFIRVFIKQLNLQILSWVLVYQGLKNKKSFTHQKWNYYYDFLF